MCLACHTQEEIAEACGVSRVTVTEKLDVLSKLSAHEKATKLAANFDDDFAPSIEVNQHNELIDGYHRWTAHKLAEVENINVKVTTTVSDNEFLGLAIERNSIHGLQLSHSDKQRMARQLYLAKTHDRAALQKLLSVSAALLSNWLSDIDQAEREERNRKIQELYLACYTAEENSERINEGQKLVEKETKAFLLSSDLKKIGKPSFSEDDFAPPIYNVWAFAKKTNEVSHFGNSEQRIVENLLWLYTEPFDIVVDPFGGGGSTIDVCKKRLQFGQ